MSESIVTVGSKPIGLKGLIAGKIMNLIHIKLYSEIIEKYILMSNEISEGLKVLDIGCGGIAVKIFSRGLGVIKVYGIDYSSEMVSLSKRVNRKRLEDGTVEIIKADVSDIPLNASSIDIVTYY